VGAPLRSRTYSRLLDNFDRFLGDGAFDEAAIREFDARVHPSYVTEANVTEAKFRLTGPQVVRKMVPESDCIRV
jgi:hypothetical protein